MVRGPPATENNRRLLLRAEHYSQRFYLVAELESGRGFVLVRMSRSTGTARGGPPVSSDLGRHLGIPVSQNATGHTLGHIEDTHELRAPQGIDGQQRARTTVSHTPVVAHPASPSQAAPTFWGDAHPLPVAATESRHAM
ncbi:hypothetical protein GCM10015535_41760 [Streptomyces gelaticus]|uniref:Uncharacterized protein n=1 Tax=Streptomyces gelaticus TaxID=285446 RepID=A0ABQ2W289_9ACTN|nr:hypothetical protein GCM10015535_41760 [Streptomyces gelaticus]